EHYAGGDRDRAGVLSTRSRLPVQDHGPLRQRDSAEPERQVRGFHIARLVRRRAAQGPSSFSMEPTPVAVPSVPKLGLDSWTRNVSSDSGVVSPTTCTVTVSVVTPGENVRVPLVG